jgi:hypothetical protein
MAFIMNAAPHFPNRIWSKQQYSTTLSYVTWVHVHIRPVAWRGLRHQVALVTLGTDALYSHAHAGDCCGLKVCGQVW